MCRMQPPAIAVRGLDFRYPEPAGVTGVSDTRREAGPLFAGLSLDIPAGSRCLLLGQNGVGKTTLLRVLAGRHLVPESAVRVLGRSAFHDTSLAGRVVFLGGPFPFDVDLSVAEILRGRRHEEAGPARPGVAEGREARLSRLLTVLGIDPAWRMARLSSGQRRRVQILLGLLPEVEVVLLDEVTADLDVLARADLLDLLREESEARGVTVVYATHVLDGLTRWATHLLFLSPGAGPGGPGSRVRALAPLAEVPELVALQQAGAPAPLLQLTERWLREDRAALAAQRGGAGSSS